MDEIRNKVKESGIIQLDLADFKPKTPVVSIDLADQLLEGILLREKPFREWISTNDWTLYNDKIVAISCSADALIPTWAYMLVASKLIGVARYVSVGTEESVVKECIAASIASLDVASFRDQRIIIKGCSDIPAPELAMVTLMNKLQPVVKSILFGEPCSAVPVYKKR